METQAQIDGHQDKVTAYNKLSTDAQRNVDIDNLLASIIPQHWWTSTNTK
jgi:hypothetical protein